MRTPTFIFVLALTGCASTPPRPIEIGPTPTCSTETDCAAKWSAARTYVLQHAGMKIQTYSTDFLETYNSTDWSVAAQVNKQPLPGGGYAIVARFGCGSGWNCIENPRAVLAGFNETVASVGLR